MHGSQLLLEWALVALGAGTIAVGTLTLAGYEPAAPWLRGLVRWERWGWTQLALGVVCLLVGVPMLIEASADVVFVLRCAGLLVFVLGRVLDGDADLNRVRSDDGRADLTRVR